jgi:hypothetical protein
MVMNHVKKCTFDEIKAGGRDFSCQNSLGDFALVPLLQRC